MSGFVNASAGGGGSSELPEYPRFRRGKDSVRAYFERMFRERIVIYDGAMGTMIQKHRLTEEDFRVSWAGALLERVEPLDLFRGVCSGSHDRGCMPAPQQAMTPQ
jgi:hypothetical protein